MSTFYSLGLLTILVVAILWRLWRKLQAMLDDWENQEGKYFD